MQIFSHKTAVICQSNLKLKRQHGGPGFYVSICHEQKMINSGYRRIQIFDSEGKAFTGVRGFQKVSLLIRYYINTKKVDEREVSDPSTAGPWFKVNKADLVSAEVVLKQIWDSRNIHKTKPYYYDGEAQVIKLRLQSSMDRLIETMVAAEKK